MSEVTDPTAELLLLLSLFVAKHFIADFVLQWQYILRNRRYYGHPGGLLHTAIHLAGSLLCLVPMGTPPGLILKLLIVEALIHYHVDWAKDNIVIHFRLVPAQRRYWIAMGADQMLHQLTYVGLAGWWIWAR